MKIIIFIFSLFVFLIGSIVLNIVISIIPGAQNATGLMPVITGYLNIMISTMLLVLSQCIFRLKYIQKLIKKLGHINVIGEYYISPFRLVDRLIIYIFPAIPVVFPLFRSETLNKYSLWVIALFFIFIIITEILFYFFNKTMKAVITDKGIVVIGYDLRLELPISANYPNPSGFYPFERIEGFRCLKDEIIIYQTYDLGAINIKAPYEEIRKIKALLLSNNVPESRLGQ